MPTKTKSIRVRIVQDETAEDPRKGFSNLGTMVCWHQHYTLGDEQPSENPSAWLQDFAGRLVNADQPELIPAKHVERIIAKHVVMLPLFLFDHSGISMSTSNDAFRMWDSQGWDWGQIGFVYCTMERARKEWCGSDITREKLEELLESEVEVYDQYLRGDVYGYVVEELMVCDHGDEHWDTVDSCFGFYGSDIKKNGMLEQVDEQYRPALEAAAHNDNGTGFFSLTEVR